MWCFFNFFISFNKSQTYTDVILSDWNEVEGVEGSVHSFCGENGFFDSLCSLRMTNCFLVPFDRGIATHSQFIYAFSKNRTCFFGGMWYD